MLINLNEEIYQHKLEVAVQAYGGTPEYAIQKGELDKKIKLRLWMVVGEGSVFFVLLLFGILKTRQSFKKEVLLANQQKNFLLSITHELKSPIASVKLYLQTLGKRKLDEDKQREILTKALAETDRLHSLVENLLLATKVDRGDYEPYFEEIDFTRLVQSAVEKLRAELGTKAKIESELVEGVLVNGDRLALQSILHNLVENAAKYGGEGVLVSVSLLKYENEVLLKVADNGPGIQDGEKEKVFSKFYRVGNEETRKTKGTGLGLYIVKSLVEKHNGEIVVKDNEPKGAMFEVKLRLG